MSNSRPMLIRGIDPATTLSVHKFREISELNKYIIYIYKKTYTLIYIHIHINHEIDVNTRRCFNFYKTSALP